MKMIYELFTFTQHLIDRRKKQPGPPPLSPRAYAHYINYNNYENENKAMMMIIRVGDIS